MSVPCGVFSITPSETFQVPALAVSRTCHPLRSRPLKSEAGFDHRGDLRSSFGARTAVHLLGVLSALVLNRQAEFELALGIFDSLDGPLAADSPDESSR